MKAFREILAASGLLFAILTAVYGYSTLPQRIPTHFGDNGVVDVWSDKSSLWFPVGIACVVYVGMTLIRYAPESSANYPFDTQQRAAARPIGHTMVAWLKAEITWIFAGVTWSMVASAWGRNPDLTTWLTPLALGVIFVTLLYHIVRMVRLKPANAGAQ